MTKIYGDKIRQEGKIQMNGVAFNTVDFLTYFFGFLEGDGSISARIFMNDSGSFSFIWDLGVSQNQTSQLVLPLANGLRQLEVQAACFENGKKDVLNVGSVQSLLKLFQLVDTNLGIVPLCGFKARNYFLLRYLVENFSFLSAEVKIGLLFSFQKERKQDSDFTSAQKISRKQRCLQFGIDEKKTISQTDQILTLIDRQYNQHVAIIQEKNMQNQPFFNPYYVIGLIDADGSINVDRPTFLTPGKIYIVPHVRFITTYTSILSMTATKSIVGLTQTTGGKDNQKKTQGWKWSKQSDVNTWVRFFDTYLTPHVIKRRSIKLLKWGIYLRENKLLNNFSKIEPYIRESYAISDINNTTKERTLSLAESLEKIRNHVT